MSKLNRRVIFLVACAVAMLALPSAVAYAALPEEELDHFKAYLSFEGTTLDPISVVLKDQFGTVDAIVREPYFFSPPVAKTLEDATTFPIIHPEYHLTWYGLEFPEPPVVDPVHVLVTNQFYELQEWILTLPTILLVPTWKIEWWDPEGNPHPGHEQPPVGLDHYLCYPPVEPYPTYQPIEPVILNDQFHEETVTVEEPICLCNPVDKIVPDDEEPIYDEENHLACYWISPNPEFDPPIHVVATDQFYSDYQFPIWNPVILCVPSIKCIPGTPEVCDGIDNDCDGVVPTDEIDDDTDGYVECTPWVGTDPSILGGDDCDDTDPDVNPGETEVCDGKDNDCDVYPAVPADESDDDTDLYVECDPWVGSEPGILGGGDCNDSDPYVNPRATEGPVGHATCGDTLDNDCDGKTDTDDSDCKEAGCLASAAASIYETDSVGESSPSDYLAYLLVPLGIVTFLVAMRRKR